VSLGSVLLGMAVALVVGAYLARPFRMVNKYATLDRDIEAWVAQVRAAELAEGEKAVNYCPKCGRRVGPDDHFCPGCGTRLQRDTK